MKDENIQTPPQLSHAQAAVNYLLHRVKVDADVRWHMLHTEAFSRLCLAEAERTGKTVEEVAEFYSTPPERLKDMKARLVVAREVAKDVADAIRERGFGAKEWADLLDRLDRV